MDFNYAQRPQNLPGLSDLRRAARRRVSCSDEQRETTYVLAMLALIGTAAVSLYFTVSEQVVTFNGAYVTDPASGVLKMFAYVALGVTFLTRASTCRTTASRKASSSCSALFGLLGSWS
jgi:NADH:ubiquinone oxidoreductase subunit 2 (subunit N)